MLTCKPQPQVPLSTPPPVYSPRPLLLTGRCAASHPCPRPVGCSLETAFQRSASPVKEVCADVLGQHPQAPPTPYHNVRYIESHQSVTPVGTWPSASSSSGRVGTRSNGATVKPSNGHTSSNDAVASPIHSGASTADFTRDATASEAVKPGRGDETIKQLRTEIGGLRYELETLRGQLLHNDGSAATNQSSSHRAAASSPRNLGGRVSPISADVWHREAEESAMDPERRMCASSSCPQIQRTCKEPDNQAASTAILEMSTPRLPYAPTSDPLAWQPSPPTSPKRDASPSASQAARDYSTGSRRLAQRQDKHGSSSELRFHNLSPVDPHQQVHNLSASLNRTDSIDEMWCAVLRRFPQHPHWTLLKVSRGIYRMGTPTGKKLHCRISNGGLQVRVGGGWMGAVPFLQKYGPPSMGTRLGETEVDASNLDTPASMERLLVPTKSWATKIGIHTSPDVRERRRP